MGGDAAATAADLLRLTRPAINTGAIRREKTFWEVAAQAGLRTVAVNWWTSWPARDDDGIVLTERAVLRLQSGGPLAGEIVPASLYERLQARVAQPLRASDGAGRAGRWRPAPPARRRPGDGDGRHVALADGGAGAARGRARGRAATGALPRGRLQRPVDLATVYLPGLDILGTKLRALAGEQASTAVLVESAEAVRRYYGG